MSRRTNRRTFLKRTVAAGVGFWAAGGISLGQKKLAENDKLNVAFVGVGGMGGGNLDSVAKLGENVVALCDIDDDRLGSAAAKHKNAKKYNDYRKMFEQKDIDAVVVSTPDHHHAVAGLIALRLGKHLYCEKPLTYTVNEARTMRKVAAEKKVATCMGNRGTAENGFRTGVEILQAGLIGPVKEVHIWTDRPSRYWPQGMGRPKETPEVPKHIHWDLWQGPAAERPYNPAYLHFKWRGWMDYGTGALGDMACHTCNLTYMGLKLNAPTAVEAASSGLNGESWPTWSTIAFNFAARGDGFPAVKLVWYDGLKDPDKKEQNLPPEAITKGLKLPPKDKLHSGAVLLGEKGVLFSANDYGSSQTFLTPDREPMQVKAPDRTLPRAPENNNYADWVRACKSGEKALGNFDYSARLTEAILLGCVAMRAGKKIEYNAEEMKITNVAEANKYLTREYRKGFDIQG